jgi:hypothetical protein
VRQNDFVQAFVERQRARLRDPLISSSNEARCLAVQLDQLEEEWQQYQDTTLSTREAALESGYSEDNIRLLRRRGAISDRRRDLPRKPGHGVDAPQPIAVADDTVPSIADRVLGRRRA